MTPLGLTYHLQKSLKKKYPNKEIIYYILPQAWAWKKKRIPVLAKSIDKLASILPFEPSYYPSNANIKYVGHPLLDQITHYKTSLNTEIQEVAFMPGSRKTEIRNLMPIFLALIQELNINATLIIPKHFSQEEIKNLYGDIGHIKISHNTQDTLLTSDFAFICSGTATLEASIIGVPFILSYIAKPIDFFIGSRLVKIEYVGLANIMFSKWQNRTIHPEFLQEKVTVTNLLRAYREYDREGFIQNAEALRGYLGSGSSAKVAAWIRED